MNTCYGTSRVLKSSGSRRADCYASSMDILNQVAAFMVGIGYIIINFFSGATALVPSPAATVDATGQAAVATATATAVTATNGPKAYSQAELLAMADKSLDSGVVPLGDYKYSTTGAKKGYVYLCNEHKDNPGSMVNGPWITGNTWNFTKKVTVDGKVTWQNATFTNTISGAYRVLTGNDLPLGQTTGVFPVASSDDAHAYDPNPNTIKAQTMKQSLAAQPTYSATPYCMGGEVGILTNGVPLFNAFDAGLRDAPAHEVQDSNDGHPQGSGEYHYHSLPAFLHTATVTTVIGFAYDGFPITGPVVADGKYLTTSDLDECHGLTSEVTLDGKKVTTYHYVMTYDFPYSASCFRAKSAFAGPTGGGQSQTTQTTATAGAGTQPGGQGGTPPQAALTACSGKTTGASCSFTGGRGETVSGTCNTPPGSSLACVPK